MSGAKRIKRELEFETNEEISEKTKQPKFTAIVIIDNQRVGQGTGTSKKEAQQNAAEEALEKIDDLDFQELQNN